MYHTFEGLETNNALKKFFGNRRLWVRAKKYVESDTFFFYSLKNKDQELYFSTSELFLENEAMIYS